MGYNIKGNRMKKTILLLCFIAMLAPLISYSAEERSMLAMKHELAQERVLRIRSELELLRLRFQEGRAHLAMSQKELDRLAAELKKSEAKKPGKKDGDNGKSRPKAKDVGHKPPK